MTISYDVFTPRRRTRRHAFTLLEMFVILSVITVLVSLILPAIQQARDGARRLSCKNNLMQIGLALRNYESAHECLPPGSVDPNRPIKSEDKGYHVGWVVQILPHLEQLSIYNAFNFSVGVYDQKNLWATQGLISLVSCPSSPGNTYAGCHHDVEAPIDVDNNGVLFLNSSIRREDIRDGASHTIFVGEAGASGLGWASGTRATLRNTGSPINSGLVPPGSFGPVASPGGIDLLEVGGFGSGHYGGANFCFGDGSVRFLSQALALPVLRQLGNRADGELPAGEY